MERRVVVDHSWSGSAAEVRSHSSGGIVGLARFTQLRGAAGEELAGIKVTQHGGDAAVLGHRHHFAERPPWRPASVTTPERRLCPPQSPSSPARRARRWATRPGRHLGHGGRRVRRAAGAGTPGPSAGARRRAKPLAPARPDRAAVSRGALRWRRSSSRPVRTARCQHRAGVGRSLAAPPPRSDGGRHLPRPAATTRDRARRAGRRRRRSRATPATAPARGRSSAGS